MIDNFLARSRHFSITLSKGSEYNLNKLSDL